MRKVFKLLLCVALLTAAFAMPASASAAGGFEITSYDVSAVVSENNVYDVTETINVHFNMERHGIYREIPVNSEITREAADGERITTRVPSSVWDINVQGWDYSVDTGGDMVTIKIGSADKWLSGDQTYKISYKIGFGDDGVNRFDEAYFNIIGTDWEAPIQKATFSVTLPKPFENKPGFSTGYQSSTGYDPGVFKYEVSGNTISGEIQRELNPYEGVTMRLELPQGYFKVPDARIPDWIAMGVMALLAAVSVILFLMYGRDDKPVETVEFYAPDGLNSAEVGYIIDGVVDNRDVVSLIVYWADKGYLSIKELSKGKFELTKLKDMGPEAKAFELHMFDGLFRKGPSITTTQLNNKFYKTFESTKSMVKMSFASHEREVFTQKSLSVMPWVTLLSCLPVIIAVVLGFSRMGEGGMFALLAGIPLGLALLIPQYIVINLMRAWRGVKNAGLKLFIVLIFWALFAVLLVIITLGNSYEKAMPFTAIAASGIIGLCAVFIRKRTPQGVEWAGKIIGLRNFIATAESDRLQTLVNENPHYFYNVLPYAYVLGITDMWIKNFEGIALQPPQWYYGQGPFTPILFAASFNNAMTTMSSHMTSSPSSSGSGGGGGGFSGGGFSGGGGGGGGGGSW
jgi:uncharacterized membrane protein YgcG